MTRFFGALHPDRVSETNREMVRAIGQRVTAAPRETLPVYLPASPADLLASWLNVADMDVRPLRYVMLLLDSSPISRLFMVREDERGVTLVRAARDGRVADVSPPLATRRTLLGLEGVEQAYPRFGTGGVLECVTPCRDEGDGEAATPLPVSEELVSWSVVSTLTNVDVLGDSPAAAHFADILRAYADGRST